jgi:hypothetical protein
LPTDGRTYLDRWVARARRRREQLQKELAKPVDSLSALRKRRWLHRVRLALVARKNWLEARLAHVHALEALVNNALLAEEHSVAQKPVAVNVPQPAAKQTLVKANQRIVKKVALRKSAPGAATGVAPRKRKG